MDWPLNYFTPHTIIIHIISYVSWCIWCDFFLAGIDGLSVAASAMTAGSGASAGATRTKGTGGSVTSRGYVGGMDQDRHQSTDEEDRDYLDLSGDRDLDLDEHIDMVTPLSPPPPPSPESNELTWTTVFSFSGGESKTEIRPSHQRSQ